MTSLRNTHRLLVTSPGVIELREQQDLRPLGPDEVRGATLATLISPGTELASAFAPWDPAAVDYPKAIGYASVFRIDEVGPEVSGYRAGDIVFSDGPHASVQQERVSRILPVPAGLDPEVAVFARLIAVPSAALISTAARPGDRVGIAGLGLVGHLGAKAFHAAGYRVTAWDPIPERRAGLPEGVRVLAAPREDDEADRFELVVDASGHDGAAVQAARVVAKGGELVLTGTPWGRRSDASAYELLHLIFHRYLHVRSGWEWQLPREPTDFRRGSVISNFRTALGWLATGAIDVAGLARNLSPERAQDAFDAIAGRSSDTLSFVFTWNQEEQTDSE